MTDAAAKPPGSPFALSNAVDGVSHGNVLQSDDVMFDDAVVGAHEAIVDCQAANLTYYHDRKSSPKLDLSGTNVPLACDDQRRYLGTVIDGRYKLEAILGEGASAVVYQGRHQVLDKLVAIKILRPSMARDPLISKRFLIEAKACSLIDHPNVIDVLDFGTLEDGTTYSVIEYLKGDTLAKVIENNDPPMTARRLLRIAWQIADGLEAAHRCNVIHRDLKPENVFLIDKGTINDLVKILDFGIAKATSLAIMQTCAGTVFGTPYYMSPEQALGATADHRSDIYSLGVIMYEMASGMVPFVGDNVLSVLNQHVNQAPPALIDCTHPTALSFGAALADLDAMVRKCMSKKPEHRYQTTQQLQDDIERIEQKLASSIELASVASALSTRDDALSSADSADIAMAPTCVVVDDVTLTAVESRASNEQRQGQGQWTQEQAQSSSLSASTASVEPLVSSVMHPTTLSAPHDVAGDSFKQPAKTPRKVGVWIGVGAAVVAGLAGAIYVATTNGATSDNNARAAVTNELSHTASAIISAANLPALENDGVDTAKSAALEAFAQNSDTSDTNVHHATESQTDVTADTRDGADATHDAMSAMHEVHDVQLRTIPTSAQVFVDGVSKGLSPLVVRASVAQPVQVTVRRAGYQPQTTEFDGSETSVTITLQAVLSPTRSSASTKKTASSQPTSTSKKPPRAATVSTSPLKNPWPED